MNYRNHKDHEEHNEGTITERGSLYFCALRGLCGYAPLAAFVVNTKVILCATR